MDIKETNNMEELKITLTEEQKTEVQKEFDRVFENCVLWLQSYEMTKLVHNLVFASEHIHELEIYDKLLGDVNVKNNEEYKRVRSRVYDLSLIITTFKPVENIYHFDY